MIFVVIDRFKVNPGYEEMCEEHFLHHARLIEGVAGFFKWELQRPIGHGWYTCITYWESRAHYDAWRRAPAAQSDPCEEAPRGMFASHSVPEMAEVVQSSYSPLAFLGALRCAPSGRSEVV